MTDLLSAVGALVWPLPGVYLVVPVFAAGVLQHLAAHVALYTLFAIADYLL